MALYLDSWLTELVVVLSAAALALYLWFHRGYQHWKNKGVPYVEPSFPFGNVRKSILGQRSIGDVALDIYEKAEGKRFVGFYSFLRPVLMIRDPEIIRHILVKDFPAFHDRGIYMDEEEPLNRQLFFLKGSQWRPRRTKLTPAYTSGKLKGMFKTIQDCGLELAEVVAEAAERGDIVEVREVVARYTTDVIVSIGFGIESKCQRDPDAEFRHWGQRVFAPDFRASFSFMLMFVNPPLADFLRVKGGITEVSAYFRKMIADNVAYREKNKVSRRDFMDLLILLKNKGDIEGEKVLNGKSGEDWSLSLNDLSAEAFAFFIAGFETSTTTMSSAFHELALNQDVQRKLQQEIDSVLQKHGGEISYDAIAEMTYLDKVVSETLRKYPPLPILNRDCTQEYKIPESNVVLEKGTGILISLLGLHYDPEHFPDPERFDPERFSEEQKAKRHSFAYLPFGDGPRICIGMRLGQLQTKVGMVNVLSKYSVRPTEKTKAKLQYSGSTVLLLPTNGIQLRFEKRS